jgi:hypothetical protein
MAGMLILVHREKWESEIRNFRLGYLCGVEIGSYEKGRRKITEEMPRHKHSHKKLVCKLKDLLTIFTNSLLITSCLSVYLVANLAPWEISDVTSLNK